MKHILKFKKTITILILIFVIIILKTFIWDNSTLLIDLSESFDNTSPSYYLLIDRIYRLSNNKNFYSAMDDYVSCREYNNINYTFIRVCGVVGAEQLSKYISEMFYNDLYSNQKNIYRKYFIITSMGLTGGKNYIKPLENLLQNSLNKKNISYSSTNVASSLYLITGKNYNFINESGFKQNLVLDDKLINARDIIVHSKERPRSYKEMLVLDNLYRPPNDSNDYPIK